MKQSQKTLALWLVILMMAVTMVHFLNSRPTFRKNISFSDFLAAVKDNKVSQVTIQGEEYSGQFKDAQSEGGGYFVTIGPEWSEQAIEAVTKSDAKIEFKKRQDTPLWQQFVFSWLPMILLFVFFFFFMRQIQVGGGKALSFGKAKARLLTESQKKVTFADVAGIDEAKDELHEIIDFLKDPQKFTKLGGRIPKGVLLMGSPGTGKTLLAKAIAGEAGVPFFSISGSDFVEMFVGVGASRVRDLFEQGKKHAPCIIFIDEIDAVGRHRGAGLGGGHDEREQTLNQLLVEMDGFESNEGVILIAATNRPDVLDPALLRPGRFDRRIVVPRPDLKGREDILKIHARRVPVEANVNLHSIARGTPGFCGADLENLVNESALLAARKNRKAVCMQDLESARDKVMMGSERRSMIISEDEKAVTAYHEAGHTLVARMIPGTDPVHKVTIIPRGMALGLTQQLPEQDKHNYTRKYAEDQIAILMGGRLAESLIFGEITTGAGNDIERATDMARKMVCEWGMSDKMGPLAFGTKDEQIFLGRDMTRQENYSQATSVMIDEEVKRIIMTNYERAKKILEDNIELLKSMAAALLEHETLDSEQLAKIIAGEKLPPVEPRQMPPNSTPTAEKNPGVVIAPVLTQNPTTA